MLGDVFGTQEWAEEVLWMCKELSCDAVIYFELMGCLHIGSLSKLVLDTVEKKLGLPTLILRGRLYDPVTLPPREIEDRLTEFVNIAIAGKKQN